MVAVTAASSLAGAQTAAERREEMAQVRERMSDPDPLMRLAYLEEFAETGDQTLTMLAVRYALSSDDADLRAVAFRLYVGGLQSLDLEMALPEQFVEAVNSDKMNQEEKNLLYRERVYNNLWHNKIIRLKILEYDFATGRLRVAAMNKFDAPDDKFSGDGQVRGVNLSISTRINLSNTGFFHPRCQIVLAPTRDLKLAGKAACETGSRFPEMPVSMPMF